MSGSFRNSVGSNDYKSSAKRVVDDFSSLNMSGVNKMDSQGSKAKLDELR